MSTKRLSEKPRQTWAEVVLKALKRAEAPVPLSDLYGFVEALAPDHVAVNPHWRDKVRQVVQRLRDQGLAENVSKGIWTATRRKSREANSASA